MDRNRKAITAKVKWEIELRGMDTFCASAEEM